MCKAHNGRNGRGHTGKPRRAHCPAARKHGPATAQWQPTWRVKRPITHRDTGRNAMQYGLYGNAKGAVRQHAAARPVAKSCEKWG